MSRDTEQARRATFRSVFFLTIFFQFGTFPDKRSVSIGFLIGFLMCFQNSECKKSDDLLVLYIER